MADATSTIAFLASKLLSDDIWNLMEAFVFVSQNISQFDLLWQDQSEEFQKPARLIQSLVAYKQGNVLKKLTSQLPLVRYTPAEQRQPFGYSLHRVSFCVLTKLASSRLAAQYIVEKAGAEQLLRYLAYNTNVNHLVHDLVPHQVTGHEKQVQLILVTSLEGLLHFARGSQAFRTALKGCTSLPDMLRLALSKETAGLFSNASKCHEMIMDYSCLLLAALIEHSDSRKWILDWGWKDLVSSLFSFVTLDEMKDTIGSTLLLGLINLMTDSTTLDKLRRMDAVKILSPHKQKMNSRDPLFWDHFTNFLLGPERKHSRGCQKSLLCGMKRRIRNHELPTFCSWEACSAGPESSSGYCGKRFQECAACGLAAYCW